MDIAVFAPLEAFLRERIEPIQYVAFFGALAVLGAAEAALPRRGFKSPSARRRRWPANFALTAINIAVLAAIPLSGLAAADWAAAGGIGRLNILEPPAWAALVAGFLARSLVSYGVHVANHKLPLLWRVHRVHHSDPGLDVSTTVRFHPLELIYSAPISIAAVVLLGIPPLAFILYEIFDTAMAVWTHADVRLLPRLEQALAIVLVTPDMHRIHHSAWQPETDSNYGATLSIWDRLLGTYRAASASPVETFRIGLDECRDERVHSLRWMLAMPFSRSLALTVRKDASSLPVKDRTKAAEP